MTTYVITYDLVKLKDYPKLWDELRRLGGHKALESVWLLAASNAAQEVHDHLKRFVDADDRLWVSELTTQHYYANAFAGTNAWLARNPPAR